MRLMENRLQKQMRYMEQSNSTQTSIIAEKVDALVAALFHCGISSGPTPSGMLAAAEDTRGSRAPCATPAMLHGKAQLIIWLQCLNCNLGILNIAAMVSKPQLHTTSFFHKAVVTESSYPLLK